jgi:ABC-type antimicrobial peptide transport system permease subunit
MFQNYLKLAYRNLLSNKLVSAINIFGLSIAIGCCIVVYLFLKNYYTMDNFHVNADHIFMVEYVEEKNGADEIYGRSPTPLGPVLADNLPQVERAVRTQLTSVTVFSGEQLFEELLYFTDPGFFEMFTLPLAEGSPESLDEPDGVVLSPEAAQKFFPNENAMGKSITVSFGGQLKKVLTVKGVAAPFPNNTGLRYDLLMGFDAAVPLGFVEPDNWSAMTRATFLQLQPGADIATVEKSMAPYVEQHNAANPDLIIKSFKLDNLKNPNPGAYRVVNRPTEAAHPIATLMFAGVALLLFALSCFNYINISLGQSAKRLKEIGVRKVIGGRKQQLVWQFMSENLLLCFIALLLGVALTQAVLVPYFNSVMVNKISFSLTENSGIWLFLLALLAFTAVASGAYPALYISSFQTVSIFRGKSAFSNKSKLTKAFLCLQFVFAFGTVIAGVVFYSLAGEWKKQPWGYQPEGTLVVRLEDAGQYDLLKNEALQNPDILHVAPATNHVGESRWRSKIFIGAEEKEVARFEVGAGYFEAVGLQLAQGRFFDPERKTEDGQSVVVNQEFLKETNWQNPIGQQIRSKGNTYNIVGVVDNFKMAPTGVMLPAAFYLSDEASTAYLAIRYAPGTGGKVESFMKSAWTKLDAGTPFNFFHQNLVFDSFFQEFNTVSTLFGYIAGLALLISCMGLFGLASQNYAARLKESGIRKVLGASAKEIILQANRSFILLLLAASMVATGICFVGIQLMASQAADFIGDARPGFLPYLIANLLVFLVAGVAVSWQSLRLARVVPAETLRSE